MIHTAWTARDGAPQNINSLAQTSDGTLWLGTRVGLSAPFTVLPSFYQTWWFATLCALAGALLLWLGITARVRYVSQAIRLGAEERADERIRIARELHDTLLQGVQGLLLSFHVAAEKRECQPTTSQKPLLRRP